MEMKKDWSLWVAMALSVVMIILVAVSVSLPRFWSPKPQFDFLYTVRDSRGMFVWQYVPQVENGILTKDIAQAQNDASFAVPNQSIQMMPVEPRLYRYRSQTGESERISFEDAQTLRLDDRAVSPAGFTVRQSEGYGGFFGGGSGNELFLSGHFTSRKLNLRGIENAYDFQFIGWVTK